MSATVRQRELRKQNRLLVRQEALAERDLLAVLQPMADEIAERYAPGAEAEMLQLVSARQPAIAVTLARLEEVPKSYRPAEMKRSFREVFEATISQWVEAHALSRAVTITATLVDAVRDILREAVDEGRGVSETARLIRDRVGDLSLTNAARIARTEMHTAASVGSDEAARSTGLNMVKEWGAVEDQRTRWSHAIADGQTVAMGESFEVGLALLKFPGDPNGPAKEIINCRCVVLHHPVIGGQIIR